MRTETVIALAFMRGFFVYLCVGNSADVKCDSMKLIGIKTNDGYYVTNDLKNQTNYYNSNSPLLNYVINGEKPTETFHQKWVMVKTEPKLIQIYKPQPDTNKRYELKDSSLSDKFKPVWPMDEAKKWDEAEEQVIYTQGFIPELYELVSDKQPDILVDVEFEYETITEIDEIKTPKFFSYSRQGKWSHEKYQDITNKNIEFDMISKIITPSILLHTQPCKLTRQESFDIVRKYVQENIDGKYAHITSDYDFCFTVKKRVKLAKPHKYTVDENDNFFGLLGKRKKKPKYVERVATENKITIFECAPKPYQSYTVIEPFEAESQDELKELIDNYLSHLISVINEPLQYCECCNGTGVKVINQVS